MNIGRVSKGRALLTTADYDDYFESGSICENVTTNKPARWVNTNYSPGRIWYWLNENDCDSSYRKSKKDVAFSLILGEAFRKRTLFQEEGK